MLAAAALVALEKTPPLLVEDHRRAQRLAEALGEIPGIRVIHKVQTNIVIFDVSGTGLEAGAIADRLKAQGVLVGALNPRAIRLVTHYDVSEEGVERTLRALRAVVGGTANA